MILAPSVALPGVPLARRGLAGGLVFTGVGLGIAASGTLVPLLLEHGLTATWVGLGGVCAVLTAAAWGHWPEGRDGGVGGAAAGAKAVPGGFGAICLNYGLFAVGMVPHMIFLVDYVARGQGRGIAAGGGAWVLFGVGALFGAMLTGRLADRFGAAAAMRGVIGVQLGCLAMLAFVAAPGASHGAALVSGLCLSGISAAMLARINGIAGSDAGVRQAGWTRATVAWAMGQAGAAYGMAWLYARTGGYGALLGTAAGALAVAGLVEVWLAVGGLEKRLAPGRRAG